MKKQALFIIAICTALSACATTNSQDKTSEKMADKPAAEAVTPTVAPEKASKATCKKGDPGYPRCTTGGGATSGPILGGTRE